MRTRTEVKRRDARSLEMILILLLTHCHEVRGSEDRVEKSVKVG